jgi:DNA-binding transcriptional regulator YiaG
MRLTAIVTGALLLFATSASPQENGHVKDVLASIAGKEDKPAGEVFKNVKLMKDVPAARFVRIMETGFAKSLGVSCEHCHVTDRWEADEKRPKRATREMMKLVRQINETLKTMPDVDNADATVNCTTCHRGFVKPALQMK